MDHLALTDLDSGSTARIAVRYGCNCFSFIPNLDGHAIEVLTAQPDFIDQGVKPSRSGIPLLFPYPNRIEHGRYAWNGREYHLPQERVGYSGPHAIHGFCLDRPWRVVKQTKSSVTAQFRLSVDAPDRLDLWPADFEIEARYELLGPALRCDIRVTNPDSRPFPFGFGTHGYFRAPLASGSRFEDCLVQAPSSQYFELVDSLPVGRAKPVEPSRDLRDGLALGGLKLDDVYTGLSYENGRLVTRLVDPEAGLELVQFADGGFRDIVAFTPYWSQAVCLEPYTCMTNAINLQSETFDAGLRVLEAGEEWTSWFELRIGRVVA